MRILIIATAVLSLTASAFAQPSYAPGPWNTSATGAVTATGNVNLGSYYLSGDGADNGLFFSGEDATFSGSVGVGAIAGTSGAINLPEGTTPADGIFFGGDVNLYRSAANSLRTDDSLFFPTGYTNTIYNVGSVLAGSFKPTPGGSDILFRNFASTELARITDTGNVGIGTATATPDARLHAELDSATTDAAVEVTRTTVTSTGTPAAGLAARHTFELETSADNNELGAYIQARITDATAASEDFALDFGTMAGGAAAATGMSLENGTLTRTGGLVVGTESVTCASDVCAYSSTFESSYYTTEANAAADVLTVTDGVAGQRRTFVLKTDGGDDLEVTPTNFANGAKVTLDTAGESVTLEFDGTNWFIISTYGGTVS